MLYRIKDYIPTSTYVNIYHSLFESHLSYCISVWGGASQDEIDKLFVTQKYCIRILFGKEPYWFVTESCQRVLTYNEQMRPDYSKEHTKQLFNSNNLLTVNNLYNYYTLTELYKVMKFRIPYSVFSKFTISDRKILLILQKCKSRKRKRQFFFNAAVKWNQVSRYLIDSYSIKMQNSNHTNANTDEVATIHYDLTSSVSKIKTKLKEIIMSIQSHGDNNEWFCSNSELIPHMRLSILAGKPVNRYDNTQHFKINKNMYYIFEQIVYK